MVTENNMHPDKEYVPTPEEKFGEFVAKVEERVEGQGMGGAGQYIWVGHQILANLRWVQTELARPPEEDRSRSRDQRLINAVRIQIMASELVDLALDEWPEDEGRPKLQELLTRLRICNGHIKRALACCEADEIEEFAAQK